MKDLSNYACARLLFVCSLVAESFSPEQISPLNLQDFDLLICGFLEEQVRAFQDGLKGGFGRREDIRHE